jgi:hypothetical protein
VPVFGGLLIIYQKGEPLIFQEEMSDQVGTLTNNEPRVINASPSSLSIDSK